MAFNAGVQNRLEGLSDVHESASEAKSNGLPILPKLRVTLTTSYMSRHHPISVVKHMAIVLVTELRLPPNDMGGKPVIFHVYHLLEVQYNSLYVQ